MAENIKDNIWLTSRVRMISERKCRRYQNISFLSITYYSLFTVVLSIFSSYYSKPYPFLEQINLSASVVVLVASLVAGGFRFETSATVFRECYLKLQALYDQDELSDAERTAKYRELMLDYPNHKDEDYYDLLVNHTLLEGKHLKNGDYKLEWTWYMLSSFLARSLFYYGLVAALFFVPIIFLALPFLGEATPPQVQAP
ncbi:SLATT domain-containing protein [Sinorhizobium medicae]|uniref:SLATT domain-containing protein n=1 Tax=Sinorhizobium medicae TaxID=110321 RepID=UPI001296CA76|nr:SLATT domain-containing protein [Sinorhizobium medicae]MQY00676.1 SLATT domain-containing protein [Sinorhizobium medicae]